MTRLVRAILCAGSALAGVSCEAGHDPAVTTVQVYDLFTALPRASVQVHSPNYIGREDVSIAGEIRPALLLHPAARVTFPAIQLPARALLTFRIGVDEQAWTKQGDGVEFSVFVIRSNGASVNVFSRRIDPNHNPDDRRWLEERIPLDVFHDENVQIELATGPGPSGDYSYDWGVWSNPQIQMTDSPAPTLQ